MLTLPYNALAWTEIVPGVGQTFVQYNVYRDDVRIAIIDDIDTVTYNDYEATPNVEHTYGVSWMSNTAGDLLESVPTEVAETLAFTSAFLHVVGSEASYVELPATSVAVGYVQTTQLVRARGRRTPSLIVGEGLWREVSVSLAPQYHSVPGFWNALVTLQEAQYSSGAMLCLRTGYSSTRIMVALLNGINKADDPKFSTVTLDAVEVYYDEEV